jgi:magnesium chelatase family protein
VLRYRQKLSGPVIDRMDIQKYGGVVNFFESHSKAPSSAEIQERVSVARKVQQQRYRRIPSVTCNAQLTPSLIKEYCQLEQGGEKLIQKAYERFQYSGRTIHKFITIARTFADLDEQEAFVSKIL